MADSALLLLLPQLLLSVALAHWLLRQHLLRRSADSALLLLLPRLLGAGTSSLRGGLGAG